MFTINKYLLWLVNILLACIYGTVNTSVLTHQVIASGGNYTTSGNTSLGHTIGQPFIPAQNSQFIAGFWHGSAEELLATLIIIPPESTTCNTSFEVKVQLQLPEGQEVDQANIVLKFDPAILKVDGSVKIGSGFTELLPSTVKNGNISFMGIAIPPVSGMADVMTIPFQVKPGILADNVTLGFEGSKTAIRSSGKPISLAELEPTTFPVKSKGQLTGVVPGAKGHWLRIHVYPFISSKPEDEIIHESIKMDSDQFVLDGEFELGATYTVYVSATNALQQKRDIVARCGGNPKQFDKLQRGDVVGYNGQTFQNEPPDNLIDGNDASMFATFCNSPTKIEADKIDYNLDGVVDVQDSDPLFLTEHFDLNDNGKVDCEKKGVDAQVFTEVFSKAGTLEILGEMNENERPYLKKGHRVPLLTVGSHFKATVKIQTGTQPIDTAGVLLSFDPTLLKVNQIEISDYLNTPIYHTPVENNQGRIYSIAIHLLADRPQGTFTLITANFTLLAAGGQDTLTTQVNAFAYGKKLSNITAETIISTDDDNTVQLTLTKQGSGTITSDIGGIDCGVTCVANYPPGTTVMLTAAPASDFKKWVGNCQGTTNPLIVNMDADKNCTAVFGTDLLVELGDFSITPTANNTLLITWQTLSEDDTLAFHLWQAQPTSEGLCADYSNTTDVIRLTTEPIEAQGSFESGDLYEYEIADDLTDYCYGLEEIDSQGNRTFYIIGPGIDDWLLIPHLETEVDDWLPIPH
ncbi:MAG: hypothetical protein HC877_08005 [Thioploca sp.]|nr:hypothetical protein [Thioploca sp.]